MWSLILQFEDLLKVLNGDPVAGLIIRLKIEQHPHETGKYVIYTLLSCSEIEPFVCITVSIGLAVDLTGSFLIFT